MGTIPSVMIEVDWVRFVDRNDKPKEDPRN